MVESRRRTSLLGALALLGGAAALVLTRFNPTPWQSVPVGPLTLATGTAVALGAAAVAVLALVAAASSPRTGTGLPLFAIVVCAGALLLAFKPGLFRTRPGPPAGPHAAPPAAQAPTTQAAPLATDDAPAPHVKTIFDSDYPSSTPPPRAESGRAGSAASTVAASPSPAGPAGAAQAATPLKPAAGLRAAREKLDAARAEVAHSLASTPDYQAAKSDAEAADENLKAARVMYDPGSTPLIAASRAAMAAHKHVQKLIDDAAARDPACQAAEHELRAAQAR